MGLFPIKLKDIVPVAEAPYNSILVTAVASTPVNSLTALISAATLSTEVFVDVVDILILTVVEPKCPLIVRLVALIAAPTAPVVPIPSLCKLYAPIEVVLAFSIVISIVSAPLKPTWKSFPVKVPSNKFKLFQLV